MVARAGKDIRKGRRGVTFAGDQTRR
jgi:hypothetical protein